MPIDTQDPAVCRTHIDGVQVVYPESPLPGPLRAALYFRVGSADESLRDRGMTHLVEHLALAGLQRPALEMNGFVDSWRTVLYASGQPVDVQRFLLDACRHVCALPVDRLDTERRILQAEAAGGGSTLALLNTWRYGARGPGLLGEAELAMRWVDGLALRSWAEHWFTADNAVLTLSAPPAADLALPLPRGQHRPFAATPELPMPLPGWFNAPLDSGLAMSMPQSADAAAVAFAWILQRRMFARVREQDGAAYGIHVHRIPLGPQERLLTVGIDGLAETQDAVEQGALDCFEQLATDGPQQQELEDWRTDALYNAGTAEAIESWLQHAAVAVLGDPAAQLPLRSEWLAEIGAVTADHVRHSGARSAHSVLLALPGGRRLERPGWREVPGCSVPKASGIPYTRADDSSQLVQVGPAGLTWQRSPADPETQLTVRWDSCVGVLGWDDGVRTVIGADANRIRIEPADWRGGEALTRLIDQYAPAGSFTRMGERGAQVTPASTEPTQRTQPPQGPRPYGSTFFWVISVALAACTVLMLAAATGPYGFGALVAGAVFATLTAGSVFAAIQLRRRPRPSRPTGAGLRGWSNVAVQSVALGSSLTVLLAFGYVATGHGGAVPGVGAAVVIAFRSLRELKRRRAFTRN